MNASSSILLSGGLGNQLFQYCFARRISEELHVPILLDLTLLSLSHRTSNSRPMIEELPIVGMEFKDNSFRLNRFLSKQFKGYSDYFVRRYMREILDQATLKSMKIFKQNRSVFDTSIYPDRNALYIGSFTSYQYWKVFYSNFVDEVGSLIASYAHGSALQTTNTKKDVVIHARRGDYAYNPKTRKIHGLYGISYYLKALSELPAGQFQNLSILSDDLLFAQKLANSISGDFPNLNVDIPTVSNPIMVLHNFSSCRAFIGSNSTFSWWLSSLGGEKQRFLPTNWFSQDTFEFSKEQYFPYPVHFVSESFE